MVLMLPLSFYQDSDVVALSQALLGKFLCTRMKEGILTAGRIVETEAYAGVQDHASHAYGGRRTRRNEALYTSGGVAYVYLCYGLYPLFNVVTGIKGTPHAVLIRGIEPTDGLDLMQHRRGKTKRKCALTAGPGCLTRALGIDLSHCGLSLAGSSAAIWLEERPNSLPKEKVVCGPRIGVAYAGVDALLPWRFYFANNPWVSRSASLGK